ncbi:MAG: hypothetical protein ACYCWW_14065 [Deltaproteobacteria bacterium]
MALSAFLGAACLAVVAHVASGCQPGRQPICACLAATPVLVVQAWPDGGSVAGAYVSVTGEANGTMSCQPQGDADTFCSWSYPTRPPETQGVYDCSLHITAPGYETIDVPATIAYTVDNRSAECACATSTLSPSTVTLVSVSDGGA